MLQLYVLRYLCCDDEECGESQRAIEHVDGIFTTQIAAKKEYDFMVKEYEITEPLLIEPKYEDITFPCYMIEKLELCVSCHTYCHDLNRHMEHGHRS